MRGAEFSLISYLSKFYLLEQLPGGMSHSTIKWEDDCVVGSTQHNPSLATCWHLPARLFHFLDLVCSNTDRLAEMLCLCSAVF